MKEQSLDAFDYLVVAFMNVGYFGSKAKTRAAIDGRKAPELYTFPADFIRRHHDTSSSWQKVRLSGLDIERYKNEDGLEQIAQALEIPYPSREG